MREKHATGHEFKAFILALRAYGYRPYWSYQDPDGHKYISVVDIDGNAKNNFDEIDDNEVLILDGHISSDHPHASWVIQSVYMRWKNGKFIPDIPEVLSDKPVDQVRKRTLSVCNEIMNAMENGLINEGIINAMEILLAKNGIKK